jgi:hypothetical protein
MPPRALAPQGQSLLDIHAIEAGQVNTSRRFTATVQEQNTGNSDVNPLTKDQIFI